MRDHYFSSKFEVTSIVPENVEQVENFLIDEMNSGFQFFYQVETIAAPMVICGDAEIRLQEIFEEEIYEDQYWTDMAKNHGIVPLVNMTSMPEDADVYTSFYFINNRKSLIYPNLPIYSWDFQLSIAKSWMEVVPINVLHLNVNVHNAGSLILKEQPVRHLQEKLLQHVILTKSSSPLIAVLLMTTLWRWVLI